MNPQLDPEVILCTLAKNVQQLNQQRAQATTIVARHQNVLSVAAQKVSELEAQSSRSAPRTKKPNKSAHRGLVISWTVNMDSFLQNMDDNAASAVALSYLSGPGHEWWTFHQSTVHSSKIHSWQKASESYCPFVLILLTRRRLLETNSANGDRQKMCPLSTMIFPESFRTSRTSAWTKKLTGVLVFSDHTLGKSCAQNTTRHLLKSRAMQNT